MQCKVTLEEAIQVLNEQTYDVEIITVPLKQGWGMCSSQAIFSTIDSPPFDKSAMDGYALSKEDCMCISGELGKGECRIRVIDTVYAGGVSVKSVKKGYAIRIMTGAKVPKGTYAVIKQEEVICTGKFIRVGKTMKPLENICLKGEDYKAKTQLVWHHKKMDYADIGLLASSGIKVVEVYKKPSIAVITTGDEVVSVGKPLREGKIYNSNQYTLTSRIKELGYTVKKHVHSSDHPTQLTQLFSELAKEVEIIFTTGSVSVGEKDIIQDVLREMDAEILFWKVQIKPGSAMLCAKLGKTWIVSLSGNPTAAMTTFELLGKGILGRLEGNGEIMLQREDAILQDSFSKRSITRRFLRGWVYMEDGVQKVWMTQLKTGNGMLSTLQNSNCLIELEAGNTGVKSGEKVWIIKC